MGATPPPAALPYPAGAGGSGSRRGGMTSIGRPRVSERPRRNSHLDRVVDAKKSRPAGRRKRLSWCRPARYTDGAADGPVAQGIEQQPSKLKVAGSNPAGVANKFKYLARFCPGQKIPKILPRYTPGDTNVRPSTPQESRPPTRAPGDLSEKETPCHSCGEGAW